MKVNLAIECVSVCCSNTVRDEEITKFVSLSVKSLGVVGRACYEQGLVCCCSDTGRDIHI